MTGARRPRWTAVAGVLAVGVATVVTASRVQAATTYQPIDTGFGANGVVRPAAATDLFFRANGRIVVGDQQFLTDGTLDPAYVTPTYEVLAWDTVQVDPLLVTDDGRTIRRVGVPSFTPYAPSASATLLSAIDGRTGVVVAFSDDAAGLALVRLRADGTPDPTFGVNGRVDIPSVGRPITVSGLAERIDGTVVVAGLRLPTGPASPQTAYMRSVDAGGNLTTDYEFNTSPIDSVRHAWLDTHAGMTFAYSTADGRETQIIRFRDDGPVDPSYGIDGVTVVPVAADDLRVINGNGLVMLGYTRPNGRPAVARLDRDGLLDASFASCGTASVATGGRTAVVTDIDVQNDGQALVLGQDVTDPLHPVPFLTRFTGSADTSPTACGSGFVRVAPRRLLDTRDGTGGVAAASVPAGGQVDVRIGGEPLDSITVLPLAGVTAVMLNVTATNARAAGFVTAWPTGSARPTTSVLNLARAGDTVASLVNVPLGFGGRISLYSQTGADLVADIVGYFTVLGGDRIDMGTLRMLDTRESSGTLAADAALDVSLTTAAAPIPRSAIFGNLTATNVGGPGFVSAVDPGTPLPPDVSSLNVSPGETRANAAVFGPYATTLYTHAPADLILDVMAHASPDGTGDLLPVGPTRVLDTRSVGAAHARLAAGEAVIVHVVDPTAYDAPVNGIVATLTAVDSGGPGYLTAWGGDVIPPVSNLNIDGRGQTRPNLAFVQVDERGDIHLYSHGAADVLIDVSGVIVDRRTKLPQLDLGAPG